MSGIKACARALWSPHVLSRSVLVAWWCADDHGTANMTDDGGGSISNWVDRIGGLALTAATTARPTWASNSFNSSYAGLTFDGSANCMVSTSLTTLPTGSVAGEMWVSIVQTVAQTGVILSYGGVAAATRRRLFCNSTFHPSVSDGQVNNTDNSGRALSSPCVVNGQMFSTTQNGFNTGVAFAGNPSTIATLNTGTTRMRVGADNNTSAASFFGGTLRHVFVLTGTLATADRQKFAGWNAWDGGYQAALPASHPYQLFRP